MSVFLDNYEITTNCSVGDTVKLWGSNYSVEPKSDCNKCAFNNTGCSRNGINCESWKRTKKDSIHFVRKY